MLRLLIYICLSLIININVIAQKPIIKYDKQTNIAGIIYADHNMPKGFDKNAQIPYPATGSFSPTHYANPNVGVDKNVGFCNYLYFPTDDKLESGKQYTLKLKIKFDESYDEMTFYQDNFGIALTSYLYPNSFPSYWGLWRHTNESLGIFVGDRIVEIEQEFRPLCSSKYVILGVFKNSQMEHLHCFMCYYPFEVYELSITESKDPTKACKYFGDAFKKEKETNFKKREYNVYFDSGSSNISPLYHNLIDSLSNNIKSSIDLIALTGHTDMSGNNNIKLGAARNSSVKQAFVTGGIDPSRIIMYNLADDKAADFILSTDRQVEINLVKGDKHRKIYNDALSAIKNENFPLAHKILTDSWINAVPPKKALTAYFDCWEIDNKSMALKNHLLEKVKSKYYRGRELNFKLDSLNHERLKGRTLSAYLSMLRMPGSEHRCAFSTDLIRDSLLRNEADKIFQKYGFLDSSKVGLRASEVLPLLIMTSENIDYLEGYLTDFKEACESQKLEWSYYAKLYDKLSIIRTGFQRYGTRMDWSQSPPVPLYPYEDPTMIDEFRRQVKLAPLMKAVSVYQTERQNKLEKELVKQLNNIYNADQHYRNGVHTAHRDFPKMAEADYLNLIQVEKILDERGWLGPEIIGERGNSTLFLVIQHSNLETQLKYLPMMRKAVENGNARGQDFALLEDRVALGQGKKQIYGSQIWKDKDTGQYYVAPLEDPDKVNARRKKVGLIRIEDYVMRWQIDWEMERVQLKQ